MRSHRLIRLLALLFFANVAMIYAQTTEFTYQGRLLSASAPANGSYDFEFVLFDAMSAGTQIGPLLSRPNVAVADGIFSVKLDFGNNFPGANRYLEIRVRPTGQSGITILSPRQQISSPPYAVRSLNASSADSVPVSGVPAGSGNYIQNQSAVAQNSSFNISGNGFVGGNVGIGTTSPLSRLQVSASSGDAVRGLSTSGSGVLGSSNGGDGVVGSSNTGRGLYGYSDSGTGVSGFSPSGWAGYFNGKTFLGGNVGIGTTNPLYQLHVDGGSGLAVYGTSTASYGVFGNSSSGTGVYGLSDSSTGVSGRSTSGNGVYGFSSTGFGVYGNSGSAGLAGYFNGKVGIGTTVPIATLTVERSGPGGNPAVFGYYTGDDGRGAGVWGCSVVPCVLSPPNTGIGGYSDSGYGVYGESSSTGWAGYFRGRTYISGDVGIGTTSPLSKLHVNGDSGDAVYGFSTSGNGVTGISTSGYAGYFSGRVRINTLGSAGATSLCRNGSSEIATCSSSLRYKRDVQTFTGGLNIINRLRPISFNWKEGGKPDIGLAAEEVERVEPLLTFRNDKGEIEGVKYDQLSAVFINAIKEQQVQIKLQQKQIEQQRKQVESLTKIVCAMNAKADICRQ